tara:strand:- start:157621 stop:159090 length:1470 start_codon:yes stop_codon:yes gene_type:complete
MNIPNLSNELQHTVSPARTHLAVRDGDALISRRTALQSVAAGLASIATTTLLHQQSASASDVTESPDKTHHRATAKRVLFLCMRGGPSHVDLFDHKPHLQSVGSAQGNRRLLPSPFKFSRHGDSGLWLSEVQPHLARHVDDVCMIHSMHTDLPNHPQAFGQMHTGSFQFVRPSLGAWTLYGLGSENENLPGFVTINPPADFGGARNYGSAFLPAICQGTKIGAGQIPALYKNLLRKEASKTPPLPHLSNTRMTPGQQREQVDLVARMNQAKLRRDHYNPEVQGAIDSMELAFRMQRDVPDVLDLADESKETLDAYGIDQGPTDTFGRQCLMARRLIEAGVRFVEVTAPANWDHHRLLKTQLTSACETTDQPTAALLQDLKSRGLLQDTLVIWAGEFGRTPFVQSFDGRDHNNQGYTIWMAGGGVKGGITYGETDEFGEKAVVDRVHIHDWHATILHLLGFDHTKLTYNYAGRDFRLTDVHGEVVYGIIA